MKFVLVGYEAALYSTVISSFFVLAVYVWKPFVKAPYAIKLITKKKPNQVTAKELHAVEMFELKMRTASVCVLSLLAFLFIFYRADPS